ncbi:MAG: polyprenyl synthetase family protein [Gammaproteobacteria bacterium]|nr:polyprenyl synthetase family protein [Gammaproteobacteria bacterium]
MSTANTPQLNEFQQHCQQRVDRRLDAALDADIASATLLEAMRYACLGGGKRIRPVLTYGSALAVGGDLPAADNAAAAIELIHSYSLVHDDLPAMDDDDLRRGKPTLHKAFDEATAILVGDALQPLAFQILSTDPITENDALAANNRLAMVQLLSQAAGATGMVGGQSLDFEAVGVKLNIQQLEQMHSLKTGALIRCAVLLGGMSCETASDSQMDALAIYADNIGLAFQVQDDILDVIGDTSQLGKPQGSDSDKNKPTYVSLLGLDEAKALANSLSDKAIAALKEFPASADRLRELAAFVVSRLH